VLLLVPVAPRIATRLGTVPAMLTVRRSWRRPSR
jgi:hypothetical protein